MFKPNKLLKVVSIITIVFSVLGLIFTIFSLIMADSLNAMMQQMGLPTTTTLDYVISFLGTIVTLAAAIVALMGKSYKAAMILGIVVLVYTVITIIQTAFTMGFMASTLISLILPVLFVWGVYQSN